MIRIGYDDVMTDAEIGESDKAYSKYAK